MRYNWFDTNELIPHYATAGDYKEDVVCYVREKQRYGRQYIGEHTPTYWVLVRGTVNPFGPCDRRLTGLALAAYTAAFRACAQPVYCGSNYPSNKRGTCCVPSTWDDLAEIYMSDEHGNPQEIINQTRWFPMARMIGVRLGEPCEYGKSDVDNKFCTYEDMNMHWVCRSSMPQKFNEPNGPVQDDPSDNGFDIE